METIYSAVPGPRLAAIALALAASGCASSASKHAEAAAAVLQGGNASIENFKSGANIGIGEVERIFHVYDIDKKFVSTGRVNGVFALTPGRHIVTIHAEFLHITGITATRSIDAGEVNVPIDAVAGQRYAISGREFDRDTAEIWIIDLATGREVTAHLGFPVNVNVQPHSTVLIIPIPIR